MKTSTITSIFFLSVIVSSIAAISMAQAATSATMPVFYNSNGTAINTNSSYLAAGNYLVGDNAYYGKHLVEYYGNGTFYDPSVRMYGGSVRNSNGIAGFQLGYMDWFNNYTSTVSTIIMPALFNQNNSQVNGGTGYLSAGYYYLGGGPSSGAVQVYYYGNGTFYNPNTMTYGGSITNPNGTAGAR